MEPLTPDDLQTFLTENNIPAEIVHLDVHTPTVPAAAEAIGVVADQIVKTVVFLIDGQPHAVFANGVRRVDTRKLATRFGVNRKKVKLADGETVLQITGYAPGTVPPVGHRQKIPMLMETDVQTLIENNSRLCLCNIRQHQMEISRCFQCGSKGFTLQSDTFRYIK